jgi:hypothetical protein
VRYRYIHSANLHHLDPKLLNLPLAPLKHGQRVRLGVEHPLVQRDEVLVREQEEEVF